MAENTKTTDPGLTPDQAPVHAAEPAQAPAAQAAPDESAKVIETLRDQLLRKAAEFENYKRRSEGEFISLTRTANEGLLLSLLPVLDDLNRSLASGKDPQSHEAFFAGVEMIRAKFLKILEKHGVVPFPSTGKPFDVGFHDALMQLARADVAPGTVIQEVDPGYLLHDKVLRHAKVIVSAHPTEAEDVNGEA
jgi:molecular chaperone GrpE